MHIYEKKDAEEAINQIILQVLIIILFIKYMFNCFLKGEGAPVNPVTKYDESHSHYLKFTYIQNEMEKIASGKSNAEYQLWNVKSNPLIEYSFFSFVFQLLILMVIAGNLMQV